MVPTKLLRWPLTIQLKTLPLELPNAVKVKLAPTLLYYPTYYSYNRDYAANTSAAILQSGS
jgi:hypothetical protein